MDTRTLTITLPADIVDELDARVAAGLAQDIEDGIIDAVERTRDVGLEHWVRTEGVARLARHRAGLEPTFSYDEILTRIESRRQQRLR